MKKITTLLAIALCILSSHLFAKDNSDEIVATWETQESQQIEVYKVNDKYIGNPVSSEGVRNTTIEVLNLTYKNGQWVGKIYSKKRGRIMDVICMVEGDKLLLEITAGFASRDLEWTRIK